MAAIGYDIPGLLSVFLAWLGAAWDCLFRWWDCAPEGWRAVASLALSALVLDTITGTARAARDPAIRVCLRDFDRVFVKLLVYLSLFLLALGVDRAADKILFGSQAYVLSFAVLGTIAAREAWSMFRNLHALYRLIKEPWPFQAVEGRIDDVLDHLMGSTPVSDEDRHGNPD